MKKSFLVAILLVISLVGIGAGNGDPEFIPGGTLWVVDMPGQYDGIYGASRVGESMTEFIYPNSELKAHGSMKYGCHPFFSFRLDNIPWKEVIKLKISVFPKNAQKDVRYVPRIIFLPVDDSYYSRDWTCEKTVTPAVPVGPITRLTPENCTLIPALTQKNNGYLLLNEISATEWSLDSDILLEYLQLKSQSRKWITFSIDAEVGLNRTLNYDRVYIQAWLK